MAQIFRKAALDKLSSPEQLDKAVTIVSPSFWIAAIGGGVIIAVALIWSIFGRLPVNVTTNGIYMGTSGIYNAVAEASGVVEEVYVKEGQEVTRGQKLVQLDDSAYDDAISDLQTRIDQVESVTFYSYDDPATADTKPLLDIKSQTDVAGSSLTADQIALRERYKTLSKQRKTTSKAKKTRDEARKTYASKQAEYLAAQAAYKDAETKNIEAQTLYANCAPDDPNRQAYYEAALAAKAAMDQAQLAAENLEYEFKKAESAYSVAEQNYNTELSTKKQLEDTVSQMEAKVRADKSGKGDQYSSLEKQFDSAKGGALDQLNQEMKKQQKEADAMLFTARINGMVTNVTVSTGDAVQSGTSIFKIVSPDDEQDDVVCYVPVAEGRKIRKGMKAAVYPSTVNRQEYGHIDGEVEFVSEATATSEDLLNELGDQALVQGFQQQGSVVRITLNLGRDPETASGFKWSSKKGSTVELNPGTVVTADIVTDRKAPITMLIPYLKDKFSVNNNDDNNNAAQQSTSQQQ